MTPEKQMQTVAFWVASCKIHTLSKLVEDTEIPKEQLAFMKGQICTLDILASLITSLYTGKTFEPPEYLKALEEKDAEDNPGEVINSALERLSKDDLFASLDDLLNEG